MDLDAPATRLAHAVASALGLALGSAGPLRVRFFPALVDGDVAWASVELVHEGRWRAVAAAFDLGVHSSLARMGERGGKTALVGATGADAEPSKVGGQLAEWVRAGGLARVPVTAFDAACDALPLLARAHPLADSWWRAGFWGEWEERSVTGASLELGGDPQWGALVTATQEDDGVRFAVGGGALAPPTSHPARSVEELADALAEVLEDVGRALAVRAAYIARPFPLARAADVVLAALREAKVATRAWHAVVRDHFPYRHPDGVLERKDHLGQHFDVVFDESAQGVSVSVGHFQSSFPDEAALRTALPELVKAARQRAASLTTDKLEPGARYRVLQAFREAQAGVELTFHRREYIARDDFSIYHFHYASTGAPLALSELDDASLAVLRALSTHLQPVK